MSALGIIAALVASALFNLGVALQALDAREAPAEEGLRLSLLGRLLRRPRWLLGLALALVGFPLEAIAFAWAPFVIVQPALAAGLLLLLALGARTLGERVGPLELVGVGALVGGIALIAWGAPSHTETHRGIVPVLAAMALLSLPTLAPFALRGTRYDRGLVIAIASGFGFAASNVATKLMSDNVNLGHYTNAVLWLAATAVTGGVAVLTEMTSLQRLAATTVVPVAFAVQTFLPIVLEPVFLRERWNNSAFDGAPLVAGLVIVLGGSVLLSRTRAVSTLAAGG